MIEITIGRSGELKGPETDVIQSLIVQRKALIGILNKLMYR